MILARRKFLMGLGALIAAPAIVSVSNIMPVKAFVIRPPSEFELELLDAAKELGAQQDVDWLRGVASEWAEKTKDMAALKHPEWLRDGPSFIRNDKDTKWVFA